MGFLSDQVRPSPHHVLKLRAPSSSSTQPSVTNWRGGTRACPLQSAAPVRLGLCARRVRFLGSVQSCTRGLAPLPPICLWGVPPCRAYRPKICSKIRLKITPQTMTQNGAKRTSQWRSKSVPNRQKYASEGIPRPVRSLVAFLDRSWGGLCSPNTTNSVSNSHLTGRQNEHFGSHFGLHVGSLLGPCSVFRASRKHQKT